ncbi:MAG: DUF192 domain-containing protein [Gallionella sp.]|nr:DUF192 domain-containing protein [Gallionella sp.]
MELRVGAYAIKAEIVNTPTSRAQGLMHREEICENCGLLFVFPQVGRHDFWMKNTLIPLSIAFISDDGRIMKIVDMLPGSEKVYRGVEGTRYALEVRRGWFARNRIDTGAALQDMGTLEKFVSTVE